jgi:hypothetical protein
MGHGNLSLPEFEEKCFRFTVRCDRDMNRRIELAARKAGLSVTSFVQKHFETILEAPKAANRADDFDARTFAVENGISVTGARLWHALRQAADKHGIATLKLVDMSRALGDNLCDNYAAKPRDDLIAAGLLEEVGPSRGRDGKSYRVRGEV